MSIPSFCLRVKMCTSAAGTGVLRFPGVLRLGSSLPEEQHLLLCSLGASGAFAAPSCSFHAPWDFTPLETTMHRSLERKAGARAIQEISRWSIVSVQRAPGRQFDLSKAC